MLSSRKKIGVVAFLLFVSTFAINIKPSWADDKWVGDVNFSIAAGRGRHLSGPLLIGDARDQTALGVDFIFGQNSWPAWILLGYSQSSRSEKNYSEDFDVTLKQFDVGVYYENTASNIIRPYVAGGLASATADLTQGSSKDTASSKGLFGRLGILFRVSDRINVGLEHRILTGTSGTLLGTSTDADYTQTSFVFGVGF
jgi:hypothetical protein